MLLKYFKSNHSSTILLMPLIVLILWSDIFGLHDLKFVPLEYEMPLYKLLMSWVPNKIVSGILALVFITLQAFYMMYINRVYNFISRRTSLTSIFFVLISSAFFDLHYLHPAIVANIFVLMSIVEIFSTYRKPKAYASTFNAGFLIATASLFYINAGILLLFVFISLIIIRSFNWREWLSVLIGFAVPYILVSTSLLWLDSWVDFVTTLELIMRSHTNKLNFSISHYISAGILLMLGLFSIFKLSTTYTNSKVSTRSYFSSFIWLLILLILTFVIVPFASIELIVLVAVPLSYLLTNYYLSKGNKWVQEISFLILILSFSLFYIQKIFSNGVGTLF